jgi:hypothetical protein
LATWSAQVKQLSQEDEELIRKTESGLPTFPKERWKMVVWWIIVAIASALWILVKVRS